MLPTLRSHLFQHLVHRFPFAARLQADEDTAGIVAGHARRDGRHVRVVQDDVRRLLHQVHHHRIRGVLRPFHHGGNLADILAGEKTLGHAVEHPRGQRKSGKGDRQREAPVCQAPVQPAGIGIEHSLEAPLECAYEPVFLFMPVMLVVTQIAAAQHRHQRQRHHRRHQHRQRHHRGEFMEQQADHARHVEDRDEYRHQRNRNRNDGEAHLARALQRRRHWRHAIFDMPDNIFQHHDRVIHHQADGDGDAQQGNIIEAVAQRIHQGKAADQRNRQRQHRDDGRRQALQEQEDHHDHQRDGQVQGEFHVMDGFADRCRAVVQHPDIDRSRHLRLKLRQSCNDLVHHLHRIGIGLTLDAQGNRRLAVGPAAALGRLDAVLDIRHVLQAHRHAIAAGNHQVGKSFGIRQLAVGLQRQALARAVQHAYRGVGIGRADRRGQFIHGHVARGQLIGARIDAHCVAALAEHIHLRHAVDGGQRGGNQIFGVIIQLRQRHRRRGQHHQQHRLVGWIHLAVGRQ